MTLSIDQGGPTSPSKTAKRARRRRARKHGGSPLQDLSSGVKDKDKDPQSDVGSDITDWAKA